MNIFDPHLHPNKTLSRSSSLVGIHLNGTNVTDQAIDHLSKIKTLEGVYLDETKVTAEGAARLKNVLPNCAVRISDEFGGKVYLNDEK